GEAAMTRLIIYAVLAGLVAGSHWFAYEAGKDAQRVAQDRIEERARSEALELFQRQQAETQEIEQAGRDRAAVIATEADHRAEDIEHVDLSPEPSADPAPVCRDPFGPAYYRMRRAIAGDSAATEPARPVPRTD